MIPTLPDVPIGFLTKLGVVVAAIIGGVTAVLNGDHSEETITLIASSIATVVAVVLGRSIQNAAAIANKPAGYVSPADHPGAARG
jgi:peptidoglycan/LPS O-acetylase OafA/YrhL